MKIAGLILVGGKSKRMNGRNKAFLEYRNKSFIDNITNELDELNNIYISVDSKEKYKDLKFTLLEDIYKDIGPIGGIYSSLKEIDEKYIFITACDMPKITREFVKFLCDSIVDDVECIVITDENSRIYPLAGIYSKEIIPKIEEMIQEKDYKLLNLISRLKAKIIPISEANFDKSILDNINNLNEYNKLKN